MSDSEVIASNSEVIAGVEESKSNHISNKYLFLQSQPVTIPSLLQILKELELLDSDFDVNEFLIKLAKK